MNLRILILILVLSAASAVYAEGDDFQGDSIRLRQMEFSEWTLRDALTDIIDNTPGSITKPVYTVVFHGQNSGFRISVAHGIVFFTDYKYLGYITVDDKDFVFASRDFGDSAPRINHIPVSYTDNSKTFSIDAWLPFDSISEQTYLIKYDAAYKVSIEYWEPDYYVYVIEQKCTSRKTHAQQHLNTPMP